MRIVGLGESPMAAVGLDDQAEGLIPRLANQLSTASGRAVEWCTAARSGATIRFTRESLLTQVAAGRADRVIVALGVNDCLALTSSRLWRKELCRLSAGIREQLEPDTIIFTGVPPMRHFPALPTPLATMLGLRASLLEALLARFTESGTNLVHAPMNFVERPDGLFCRDGFHPNEKAHRLWAKQLADLMTGRH